MPCDDDKPSSSSDVKRCRNCGLDKPPSEFSTDPTTVDGLDTRCRDCRRRLSRRRNAAGAADRLPDVLACHDADTLSTAVLGALRVQYDGHPSRLLDDVRLVMREMDAADRFNAIAVLLALRELSGIAAEIGRRNQLLDELRKAPPD